MTKMDFEAAEGKFLLKKFSPQGFLNGKGDGEGDR